MPYLRCPKCRFSSYSAAHYASVDRCPACGTPLSPIEPTSDANEWLAKEIMAELDQHGGIDRPAAPAATGARRRWASPAERNRLWETVRRRLRQPGPLGLPPKVDKTDG